MTESNTQEPTKGEEPSAETPPDAAAPAAASAETNGTAPDAAAAAAASEGASPADATAIAASKDDAKKDDGIQLLPRGNPLRKLRGGVTAGIGAAFAFFLMEHDGQLPFGVPLGFLFVLVAAWGVMDFLGTFDDADDRVETSITLAALGPSLGQAAATMLLFAGSLAGGQSGVGNQWMWGVLVTGTFLLWVAAVFKLCVKLGPMAKDELGLERPLFKRHGFWLLAAAAALYLPALGIYSLWDPWETHYGEVAREILARDDWISLWWSQEGWFFSKPILNFWIQAIAMATMRTHFKSDQMLIDGGGHPILHPEWIVRAPNVLLTMVGMYFLYKGVAKVFGRRAGLLGALVLATTPDWYFLAHQTMTDMPFVSMMTAAMGLLLLGVHTQESQLARVYEVKTGKIAWRLSGWHLVFGAILICAIPQILYLFSRNLELVIHGSGPHGFRPHFDEFKSGSAGNCGLPGNEACNTVLPASIPKSTGAHPETVGAILIRTFGAFEPFVQAIMWIGVLSGVLYMAWGERRLRRLYYLAAWFFAAIATMGKGPVGFVLPMVCAFAYVCTKKRWAELLRLEIVSGVLIILCVALPWYVAMYVRHGSPFTDRLIFHDMFNRAFHHVHDTNEGDDTSLRFYLWQLGYAVFPWTGLAPLGLTYWLRRSDSSEHGKGDVAVFLFMWFLIGFALFSFMGTKFHHYIFPVTPAIAMLVGIVLDQMLGDVDPVADGRRLLYLVGSFAGIAIGTVGLARMWPGSVFGDKGLHSDPPAASLGVGITLLVLGAAIAIACMYTLRRKGASKLGDEDLDQTKIHERVMLGGAAVAGAMLIALVGRDLVIKPEGADQPGAIRLLQLFTYNYRRAWPEALDFSAILLAFAIVGGILSIALAVRAIRHHAVYAFGVFAFVWAIWGVDVYMVKCAPHWGQHETIAAYYAHRASPDELLVAYQMNWKGENFYTSNHVPAFVSTGSTFTTWMKGQREKGAKVMFFITEHSRIGGLKSEVQAKSYEELTDKALDNKFVMVRAVL